MTDVYKRQIFHGVPDEERRHIGAHLVFQAHGLQQGFIRAAQVPVSYTHLSACATPVLPLLWKASATTAANI